jgi:hypothetical protein
MDEQTIIVSDSADETSPVVVAAANATAPATEITKRSARIRKVFKGIKKRLSNIESSAKRIPDDESFSVDRVNISISSDQKGRSEGQCDINTITNVTDTVCGDDLSGEAENGPIRKEKNGVYTKKLIPDESFSVGRVVNISVSSDQTGRLENQGDVDVNINTTDIDIDSGVDLSGETENGPRKEKNGVDTEEFCDNSTIREPPFLSPASIPSLALQETPSFTDYTLSESLGVWFDSLSSLVKSKEMDTLVHSSNILVSSAAQTSLDTALNVGGMVMHTAFLPVTVPLHVAAFASDLVVKGGNAALHRFFDIIPIVVDFTPLVSMDRNDNGASQLNSADTSDKSRNKILALRTTKRTNATTSTMKQLNDDGRECDHRDNFLDRLRLDTHLIGKENDVHRAITTNCFGGIHSTTQTVSSDSTCSTDSFTMTKPDLSKFLLRVDDINIYAQSNPASETKVRVIFIDLDNNLSDEGLTSDALSQLGQRCIDIASSNEAVIDMMLPATRQEQSKISNSLRVDWKAHGQTKKDYKHLNHLSKNEFYDALRSHVLIWSGKYTGPKYHGSENHFFMARGVINGKPQNVLNLLWDSTRTKEYNNHCVERKDLSVINDDATTPSGGFHGTKIIKNETKVPFTKLSVRISALMHAQCIGDRPEDGYIIFSRSLNSGHAGCYFDGDEKTKGFCQSGNNEVILGVNIIRPVSGNPNLADLISISQVDARILPSFLAYKVAVMAVTDFFKNARKILDVTN